MPYSTASDLRAIREINVLSRWRGGKESACQAVSIPGLGRSPGEEKGNPLQYSCLGNPMDRGARRATVHGVAKSQTNTTGHAHTGEEKPIRRYTLV